MIKLQKEEASGDRDMTSLFQDWVPPKMDKLPGKRIEQAFEVTYSDKTTEVVWCKGLVKEVCPGNKKETKWLVTGSQKKFFGKGEAAFIEWDEVLDREGKTSLKKHKSTEKLDQNKWNQHGIGAWRYECNIADILRLKDEFN